MARGGEPAREGGREGWIPSTLQPGGDSDQRRRDPAAPKAARWPGEPPGVLSSRDVALASSGGAGRSGGWLGPGALGGGRICEAEDRGAGQGRSVAAPGAARGDRNVKLKVVRAHKAAQERYIGFINSKVAIDYHIDKWSEEELRLYKKRLTYSLRCIKFLLHQGLVFHGHDESEESSNRGNFIELLKFLAGNSEEVNKYVLNNAPDDTTSLSLKKAIEGLLVINGLSLQQIRGQVLVVVAKGNTDCKTFLIKYTNELSECLQRRDQDILNAISLVNVAKSRMQELRSDGWDNFLQKVTSFCIKHGVEVPAMDGAYVPYGKSACFQGLDNIVDLSVKLIVTKRHKVYDMVYLLFKLILLFLVATASVERVFSALVIVKTKTRNRIGDTVLDDCLVIFIERDIFFQVDEDDIIETFMSLRKPRINK
ncbi:uncharacterized protein [Miscanthus floridulus]|uniref:uncharacterized protein n=1 Tax=Miscanthus floridulus TaxID=154761 RepID=UPI00345A2C5E